METKDQKASKGLFDTVLDSMIFLAGIILLAITIMVTYSVTTRYLHLPTPIWVLQYTEYALLWITFLGAAWLLRQDGHIRIDTLLSILPPRIRHKIEIINNISGIFVTLIIVIYGTQHAMDLFERGILDVKATNVPRYLIFWIIPFGGLTLLLQFIRNVYNQLFRK